jgi:hypothetical protein
MGLFPGKNEVESIGNMWVKEKEVPRHILNRRADKKLDCVADLYKLVMDDKLISIRSQLLDKTLYCEGFFYIEYLNLKYTYENRLWAFSYNLEYKTSLEPRSDKGAEDFCRFIVKNKGKMGIMDAQWIDSGSQCNDEKCDYYLERLNNKLIIDRIVDLDMTNVEAVFNPAAHCWTISCRTLVGSTTWILIPPVMHLIKPKPVECAKMIEFFELVADALVQ